MNAALPGPSRAPGRWPTVRAPISQAISLSSFALAAVLLASLGLRLWGIGWGLPYSYYPDEPFLVDMARHMLQSGDFNPPAWDYPSLQVYSLVAIMAYREMLSSVFPFLAAPWMDYLLGRLLNVTYALATVYLVYRIGRTVFGDAAGILGAAFLGFSHLHVYNSHVLMTDVPATFYVTATLAIAVHLAGQPGLRAYAAAGAIAGLATSTKYTVATVFLVIVVAHLFGPGRASARNGWSLVLSGTCAALAFAVTSPYSWIDPHHFWQSFTRNDVGWAASGHEGAEGHVFVTYVRWLFLRQDVAIAWFALFGLAWGVVNRNRWVLLVAAFPLVYFITLLPWEVRFPRYLLPLLPGLSLLAGWASLRVGRLLPTRAAWMGGVWSAVIAAIVLFQLGVTLNRSLLFGQEDVRTVALNWMEANIPRGSRIVREDYTPVVPADQYRVTVLARAIDRDPSWYRREGVEYVILSNFRFGRYFHEPDRYHAQVAQYQHLFSLSQPVRTFRGPEVGAPGGEVVIYRFGP